jgi:hypothetical protein
MLQMFVNWSQNVMAQLLFCKCNPLQSTLKALKDSEHRIPCFWLLLVTRQMAMVQFKVVA